MADKAATKHRSGGVSFLGLLTILFIALKLTHYIAWSWWLVTLPLWGGLAFVAAMLLLGLVIVIIAALFK